MRMIYIQIICIIDSINKIFPMEQHYNSNQQPVWRFKARLSYCQIWEHIILHTIVEAYIVQNYQKTHARINRNQSHLVNTLGFVNDFRNRRTYLLIQRIPNRLSQVMTLNQSQTLKVLYSIFKGLDQLQEIYGNVGLSQNCICFNQNGKIKIWVNPDLSNLHPILPIKQGNKKIIQNIHNVLETVERKCFNSSFLRGFVRKLNQNYITSYHYAAEEIVKIANNMFIEIQQKCYKADTKCFHHQNYRSKDMKQQIPQRDNSTTHKKHLKTEQHHQQTSRPKKTILSSHSRKFSNHETNEAQRKRYQVLMTEKQQKNQQINQPNLYLNISNFCQSQAYNMANGLIHKSAPLSPREGDPHYQQNSINNENKSRKSYFYEEQNKNKMFFQKRPKYKTSVCETIKEDSQCDDSFSQSLKVDEKSITVSGQFQTFGILEDLSDKHLSKQNSLGKQSQFDLEAMDKQIQKRLKKKSVGKQQKSNIKKLSQLVQSNKTPKETRLSTQASGSKPKLTHQPTVRKVSIQGYKSVINQQMIKRIGKQNQMNPITNHLNHTNSLYKNNSKGQKSPGQAYIDKKYEQYIRNKNSNTLGFNLDHQKVSRHSKQTSNFEVQPVINQSKMNLHQVKRQQTNSYLNSYNLGTERSYKSGEYFISAE